MVRAKLATMCELRDYVNQLRNLDQSVRAFKGHVMWVAVQQTK